MFQILNQKMRGEEIVQRIRTKKISRISIMRKINEETSIKNAKSWRKDKRM